MHREGWRPRSRILDPGFRMMDADDRRSIRKRVSLFRDRAFHHLVGPKQPNWMSHVRVPSPEMSWITSLAAMAGRIERGLSRPAAPRLRRGRPRRIRPPRGERTGRSTAERDDRSGVLGSSGPRVRRVGAFGLGRDPDVGRWRQAMIAVRQEGLQPESPGRMGGDERRSRCGGGGRRADRLERRDGEAISWCPRGPWRRGAEGDPA